MPEAIRCKVPGILAEQLGDRTKDATLHEHPPVHVVVPVQFAEALDWYAVQDDRPLDGVDPPALDSVGADSIDGSGSDLETDVRELVRPEALEVVGRGRDRHLEQVHSIVQHGQVRAGDRSTRSAAMAIPPAAEVWLAAVDATRSGHVAILRRVTLR